MDQKTIARLEEFEKSKQYYDALQFCRTKVTRCFRLKNGVEQVKPLLNYAVDYFLKEKQYQCAVDIAILFSETLLKNSVPMSDDLFQLLATNSAKLAAIVDHGKFEGNEQEESLYVANRRKYAEIAIQWTKNLSSSAQETKFGSSRFHFILASKYVEFELLDLARNHYLLSNEPDAYGKYLLNLFKSHNEDFDLVILQAVMELLCIDRYPDARATFSSYIRHNSMNPAGPFDLPLLNFTNLLLDSISSVDFKQFSSIVEMYMPEISREQCFKGFLSKIGELYFGVKDNQNQGMGLAGLLSGFLGSEAQEERAISHLPEGAQAPPTQRTTPGFTAAAPPKPAPKKMVVDDDLD